MNKIIFFGNGPLADAALGVLKGKFEIVFHAHTKEDLVQVKAIKHEIPEAHGVLASFGVLIKSDVLEMFESEGILNIHPSLLPKYRGAYRECYFGRRYRFFRIYNEASKSHGCWASILSDYFKGSTSR